jgi:isoleucyl-tRNA synthetase
MYYKLTKDTENQIEKVLKSQSDFIVKALKRPLLPISEKPESSEIIIEEEQEVKYND